MEEHVGASPTHFLAGLHHARERLSATPFAGVSIADEVLPNLRRLSLPRARYFVFYEVDEAAGVVTVLRVWHTSRGRPPTFAKR